jgi:hypothetical protein
MTENKNKSLVSAKSTSFLTRLFSWFKKTKSSDATLIINPMPVKDPMDWRLTKNSRPWFTTTYCSFCRHTTEHLENMSGICNSCGSHGSMIQHRSGREIWNGRKWVLQRKYGNGPKDYEILEDYTAADFMDKWDRRRY